MAAFLLIVCFPLLLAVGFGSLFAVANGVGRGRLPLDLSSFFLYPVLLAVPFTVALSVIGRQGLYAGTGLAVPRIAGWGPWASLAASVAAGVLLGWALFSNELLTARLLRRLTRKSRGLQRTLEGGSQDFADQQQGTPFSVLLLVSVFIVFAEELLWRGYLIHVFTGPFSLSQPVALLLSSAAFGLNHVYFGLRNILLKALAGLIWGALFLWTGSLVAAVVSHYTFEILALRRMRR
ncbi:MAG TPA: type II CAAX endopeptidase family protein [Thermoanaerobaculia bacterium]|nr:type II CAAX endopeptidase family protein [Thermoanaerobaculia bacterium]